MASSTLFAESRLMRDTFTTANLELPRILALYSEEAMARVHVSPIQPQQPPHLAHTIKDGKNLFTTNVDNVFSYYEAAIETLNEIGYPTGAKKLKCRRLHLKTLFEGLNIYMIMLLTLMEEHYDSLDDETSDAINFDYSNLKATILPHLGQLEPWGKSEVEAQRIAEISELKTLMAIAPPTESTFQQKTKPVKDVERLSGNGREVFHQVKNTEHHLEQSEETTNGDGAVVSSGELSGSFAGLSFADHNAKPTDIEGETGSPTSSSTYIESLIRDPPTLSHGMTEKTGSDRAIGREQTDLDSTHESTYDDLDMNFSNEAFAIYRVRDGEETADESEVESCSYSEYDDEYTGEEAGDEMVNDVDELEYDGPEPFPDFYETAGVNEQLSDSPISNPIQPIHYSDDKYNSSSEPDQGPSTTETTLLEDAKQSAEKPAEIEEWAEKTDETLSVWSEYPRENLDELRAPLSPRRVNKCDGVDGGHWLVASILGAAVVFGTPMYLTYPIYTTIAVVGIIRIIRCFA